jgi:hypothetical protein
MDMYRWVGSTALPRTRIVKFEASGGDYPTTRPENELRTHTNMRYDAGKQEIRGVRSSIRGSSRLADEPDRVGQPSNPGRRCGVRNEIAIVIMIVIGIGTEVSNSGSRSGPVSLPITPPREDIHHPTQPLQIIPPKGR